MGANYTGVPPAFGSGPYMSGLGARKRLDQVGPVNNEPNHPNMMLIDIK
jgi:hypothetical protein